MSEVMVITGSANKGTPFEGLPSNLSEIVSQGNGVHSRNGSLRGKTNAFKCRCMTAAASTNSKENGTKNAATATEDSAEEASCGSERDITVTAASLSTAINSTTEPVRKEHKSTQTLVSSVNGGINGGLIGSTRASISEATVDNAPYPNQLSI